MSNKINKIMLKLLNKNIILFINVSFFFFSCRENKLNEINQNTCDTLANRNIELSMNLKNKVKEYPGILIINRDSLFELHESNKISSSNLVFCNNNYQQIYGKSYLFKKFDTLRLKKMAFNFLEKRENIVEKLNNIKFLYTYELSIDNFGFSKIAVFKWDDNYISFIDNNKKMIVFLSSGFYGEIKRLKRTGLEYLFYGFLMKVKRGEYKVIFMRYNGCYFEPYHSEWLRLPDKEFFINGKICKSN